MACKATMDLKPKESGFVISQTEKSALLTCEFCGRYNSKNKVEVEVLVTKMTSYGRPISVLVQELNAVIVSGSLLRVTGQLEKLSYQDRKTGKEVEKFRLVAYMVEPSAEPEPIFSVAYVQGGVKFPSAPKEPKINDSVLHFSVFSEPSGGYDREAYLTVFVSAFDGQISHIKRMKLHERSHVIAVGKLEAGNKPNILCMKLYDISYASIKAKEGKES